MSLKTCSVCSTTFSCVAKSDTVPGDHIVNKCWCNDYPAIMPADYSQDCRCEACLAIAITSRIEQNLDSKRIEYKLKVAQQFKTSEKLIEYIDYTIEGGYHVFSKWYLLKRGYCCGNDCRNCPYGDTEYKR